MTAAARWCRGLSALALWGLVVVLVGVLVGAGETSGQQLNHAGLVVTFPDGSVERRCVEFAEEEISGAELLRRSGLSVVFSSSGGFGEGVCRIGDTGCSDPGDCFCQCQGSDCAYWSYFTVQDGEWRTQNVGASQRTVRDGDVDGWVWGSGREPPPGAAAVEGCGQPDGEPPPPESEVAAASTPVDPPPDAAGPPPDSGGPPPDPGVPLEQAATTQVDPPPDATLVSPVETGAPDEAQRPADVPEADAGVAQDVLPEDDDGGGLPVGLIAFGVVAGLLAIAIGGLALRRRAGG